MCVSFTNLIKICYNCILAWILIMNLVLNGLILFLTKQFQNHSESNHDQKCQQLQLQLHPGSQRSTHTCLVLKPKTTSGIYRPRKNSLNNSNGSRKLDIRHFDTILKIDAENLIVE